MTKLQEFRDWLSLLYLDCFNEQEVEVWLPLEKTLIKFDQIFGDEISGVISSVE